MELTPEPLMNVVDMDNSLEAHVVPAAATTAHIAAPAAIAVLAGDGDDTDRGRAFFASRMYTCKDDIIAAVVEYNYVRRRAYKVMTSDRRRYQVRCINAACPFLVSFAFSTAFKPPTRFKAHTCSALTTTGGLAAPIATTNAATDATTTTTTSAAALVSSRACRAKQIARYPEVRALVVAHGAHVKAAWIKDLLVRNGLTPTYANCFHARRRLLHELAENPHAFLAQQQQSQQSQSSQSGHLLSLATFAAAPALEGINSSSSSSSDVAVGTGVISDSAAKRQRTAESDSPSSEPTAAAATATERIGCCFVSPSVPVAASQLQTQSQLLQWHVRDATRVKTFVDLYDGNRRIEILRTGTYRLHLYVEPVTHITSAPVVGRTDDLDDAIDTSSGSSSAILQDVGDVDGDGNGGDDATYHLLVNNTPLRVFQQHRDVSVSSDFDNEEHGDDDDDDSAAVPTRVFHVAIVALQQWDMLVLRRSPQLHASGDSSSSSDNVHTAFVRLIIEQA